MNQWVGRKKLKKNCISVMNSDKSTTKTVYSPEKLQIYCDYDITKTEIQTSCAEHLVFGHTHHATIKFFLHECLPHRSDRYYLASWIDPTNSENNPLRAQVENVLSQYSKDLLIKLSTKFLVVLPHL